MQTEESKSGLVFWVLPSACGLKKPQQHGGRNFPFSKQKVFWCACEEKRRNSPSSWLLCVAVQVHKFWMPMQGDKGIKDLWECVRGRGAEPGVSLWGLDVQSDWMCLLTGKTRTKSSHCFCSCSLWGLPIAIWFGTVETSIPAGKGCRNSQSCRAGERDGKGWKRDEEGWERLPRDGKAAQGWELLAGWSRSRFSAPGSGSALRSSSAMKYSAFRRNTTL